MFQVSLNCLKIILIMSDIHTVSFIKDAMKLRLKTSKEASLINCLVNVFFTAKWRSLRGLQAGFQHRTPSGSLKFLEKVLAGKFKCA